MISYTKKILFILLLSHTALYGMNMQLLEENNILNFVEIDNKNDQVTFKKNFLPFFQELLDNKQEKSLFSLKNILGIFGLSAIIINFVFLFQLFDTTQKQMENTKQQISNAQKQLDEKYNLLAHYLNEYRKLFAGQQNITSKYNKKFIGLSDVMKKRVTEILQEQQKLVHAVNLLR
jgi:hypothetical protein